MPEPDTNSNGRASIREVYALVGAVEQRLAGQLHAVKEDLLAALKQHEKEHERSARQGRHWVSALLTAVGIVASLSVGVLALVLR